MGERKLFLEIDGEMKEFPTPCGIEPLFESTANRADNSIFKDIRDGVEVSIPIREEDMKVFINEMEKECSVVDITDWPAQMIKKLIFTFPRTEKLITRNPDHYFALQMEEGFSCVAGGYDTLYDLPLILDKKGKIRAATVGFERKGGGNDE